MIAVTLYGLNSKGFPEDFPKSIRVTEKDLITGEDLLMTLDEYLDYKKKKDEQFTAPEIEESDDIQIIIDKLRKLSKNDKDFISQQIDLKLPQGSELNSKK